MAGTGGARWLTIGVFAKATRLSPKALRLYDDLGLLRPARVDPDSGYRYYTPEQVERARLVAWLRRLGMPLTGIREVCALDGPAAAGAVRAYWARVEAETSARRDLAAFLVDTLSREDTDMTSPALELRYAALSDRGLIRASNQDTAYAGARILAVADGFGPDGAPASAAAVEALRSLERSPDSEPGTGADTGTGTQTGTGTGPFAAGHILNALQDAVDAAVRAVRDTAHRPSDTESDTESDPESGTTLTALLWAGSRIALVHIGDTRAHVLRDGQLFRITDDHTLVQSLIDEGRLTPDEAASHPQRTLLLRALTSGATGATPDLRLHEARPGDRYLLCSDGLSTVVPPDGLRRVLTTAPDPDTAVRSLIEEAHRAGAPDNVSCAVADVVTPTV
ncbi:MerR family transcriptional regulator [Streptomyces sp. NPDC058001]|uniref:MerR family transcriptional regulator n=1 Tax=Streptomyces sp. NPDC058001 TaxID=3346300 RepID=UPI0036E300CD